jgi:predicted Fe-Mo cluster-binding NifX family protein
MLIAIPTINEKVITKRFGRMTEVTFVELEDHQIKSRYAKAITSGCEDDQHTGHGKHQHDHHSPKHTEIINNLCEADLIVYQSMCKNWNARLSPCNPNLMHTHKELLDDILNELKAI